MGLLLASPLTHAGYDGGHVKLFYDQSLESSDHSPLNGQLRLKFKDNQQQWSWQLDAVGETHVLCDIDCGKKARIDRANVQYVGEQWQATVGRHAISWGNGLIFNPVDIFNPFNPLAIDREYKPGDDLALAEILRDNGDNIQFLWVDHDSDYSLASKYHGFHGQSEYDLIAAKHYGENLASIGFSHPIGDWLWRSEYQYQHLEISGTAHSLVSNLQRFFDVAGKPTSLTLEWYHNGLAIDKNATNLERQQLLTRLTRGEIFTPGQDYLAVALMSQMTALWSMGLTHITEAENNSHITQLISHQNLASDVDLLLALNLPWGSDPWREILGTPTQQRTLTAQFAWYF